VADWDSADSMESDEDAAWRDLIARFDVPAPAEQPAPWPDREDVPAQRTVQTVDEEDEHFVPPAPPPLPSLDPLTKGAWVALFGGPGYLFVATAAGWSVPAFGAFCAVAAFVAGFAILVLRMHEPGPGGPGDGDDGAVV
jgi:hypothetical protein